MAEKATDGKVADRDAVNAAEVFLKHTTPVNVEDKSLADNSAIEILTELVNAVDEKNKNKAKMLEHMTLEDIIDVETTS
jgi:hypothetical protein